MIPKEQVVQQFEMRVFDESYHRIFKCLSVLKEDQLWKKPNTEIPAIGNLILHLCGNARQWILSGIGGRLDNRERDLEFIVHKNIKKTDLIFLLENLRVNLKEVLSEMPERKLLENLTIQGFTESGFSVLIHVIEHFSYHTGQITTLTKIYSGIDLGYYGDSDLNKLNKTS
jgi:uncharacterized damage-inducible protein DinB|tara:strand:- start:107764 stop:108276 length:513 start_codon:yes stop_codon:yes gene_type:complete